MLFYAITFLVAIYFNITDATIESYEYGVHYLGEEIAYTAQGTIEPFLTHYDHVVKRQAIRPDMKEEFHYLKVEYQSPVSNVTVSYNPETMTITFLIRFPLLEIYYGVIGISMKKERKVEVDSWHSY
ncbi:uncharacterized protein LOC142983414 [Anticarsia gemmatalis]|uniref:uncharacterized protein LOC142983414 n=1 Tax=Anticarsia gemmatalis TaxID=129554 RepID=UPI003F767598